MALKITSGPATEPITLAEAKLQLKVTGTDEDALITELIKSAREMVEDIVGRQLMTATYELYLDAFPSGVISLKPPVQSISKVEYIASDGSVYGTLAAGEYQYDLVSEPVRLMPAYDHSWPSTKAVPNAVKVTFVAGYTSAANVPVKFINAMKQFIQFMYYNRGDEGHRTIPKAFFDLLSDRVYMI